MLKVNNTEESKLEYWFLFISGIRIDLRPVNLLPPIILQIAYSCRLYIIYWVNKLKATWNWLNGVWSPLIQGLHYFPSNCIRSCQLYELHLGPREDNLSKQLKGTFWFWLIGQVNEVDLGNYILQYPLYRKRRLCFTHRPPFSRISE